MTSNLIFLIMIFCITCTAPLMGVNVAVTSESSVKIDAAKELFLSLFPQEEVVILAYPSCSQVSEQPVGREEGLKGALNRIDTLPKKLFNRADYVISVENYIEEEVSWVDRAVVIVDDLVHQRKSIAYSSSVQVPEHFVTEAMSQGVTVGEAIKQQFPNRTIDAQDWHQEPEFGVSSRKKLIKDALFKAFHQKEIALFKELVTEHQNFPKQGVVFQDFSPLMRNPKAFQTCIDLLAKRASDQEIELVVGLESRGFILGAALAYKLGVPFVPVRKAGKIPGEVYEVAYQKEYGEDRFALAKDAISKGQRILVIDDLIATGGSAKAGIELVKMAGGELIEFVSLLEISELNGAKQLGIPTFNLIDSTRRFL